MMIEMKWLKRFFTKKKSRLHKAIDDLRDRGVRIGNGTVLYDCVIDGNYPHLIEIGENCTLSYATILAHDGSTITYLGKQSVGKVVIKDNCFIGYGAIILSGTTIGPNSVIGAGSVVTKDVLPNSVYAGNPARLICSLQDYLEKRKESGMLLDYQVANYQTPEDISILQRLSKE